MKPVPNKLRLDKPLAGNMSGSYNERCAYQPKCFPQSSASRSFKSHRRIKCVNRGRKHACPALFQAVGSWGSAGPPCRRIPTFLKESIYLIFGIPWNMRGSELKLGSGRYVRRGVTKIVRNREKHLGRHLKLPR